jgi:hypothetical protein
MNEVELNRKLLSRLNDEISFRLNEIHALSTSQQLALPNDSQWQDLNRLRFNLMTCLVNRANIHLRLNDKSNARFDLEAATASATSSSSMSTSTTTTTTTTLSSTNLLSILNQLIDISKQDHIDFNQLPSLLESQVN